MTTFVKHIGRHESTGQRLVVVFMELPYNSESPDDIDYALVVFSDSLPDKYHQSLMDAVTSHEGQSARNFYEVLSRKVFWHGGQMLDTLHNEGLLSKIHSSHIIMTPNSSTNVKLSEIVSNMRAIESGATVSPEQPTDTQVSINVSESQKEENRKIAQNLLIQANLLREDAERKVQEAYKYDPSLRPPEGKVIQMKKPAAKKKTDAPSTT